MTISYHIVTSPLGWHSSIALDHLRIQSNHRKLVAAVKRDEGEQKRCFCASKMRLDQKVVAKEAGNFRWLNEAEVDEQYDYWSELDRTR